MALGVACKEVVAVLQGSKIAVQLAKGHQLQCTDEAFCTGWTVIKGYWLDGIMHLMEHLMLLLLLLLLLG